MRRARCGKEKLRKIQGEQNAGPGGTKNGTNNGMNDRTDTGTDDGTAVCAQKLPKKTFIAENAETPRTQRRLRATGPELRGRNAKNQGAA